MKLIRSKQIIYLLLALIGTTACSDELNPGFQPSEEGLRLSGYNAQSVQVSSRAGDVIKGFFPEDTHYRLWMYDVTSDKEVPRENMAPVVGWDVKTGSEHYINLPDNSLLNFVDDKTPVKFYGLTDPAIQKVHSTDDAHKTFDNAYLKPDEKTDTPQYTVTLQNDTLPDLRATVSELHKKGESYVIQLPFKHILSKVNFEIVQQMDDNGKGKYGELTLEGIQVLNQPESGTFDVKQSIFISFNEKIKNYVVQEKSTSSNTPGTPTGITGVPIGTQPKEVGSILLFPMTAESITENNMLKVQVTLGSETKDLLLPFDKDGNSITGAEGNYRLALECPIYSTTSTDEKTGKQNPLKLEPNYEYDIQFVIMSNDVRIITIVPRVYEWLDGETDKKDEDGNGYEEQDMGQPVTFGGVVWNDRNLGANSAHPLNDVDEWRKSVGYFYQFNRNIPYFPNTYKDKDVNLNTPLDEAFKENASEDNNKGFRTLYPVVNYKAWDLNYVRPKENWYPPQKSGDRQAIKPISGKPHNNFVYTLGGKAKPFNDGTSDGNIIRFGINYSYNGIQKDEHDVELPERMFPGQRWLWRKEDGTKGEQPCPKGWSIPTEEQFKSIIPTSGYAGNITFRRYLNKKGKEDGGWEAATGNENQQFREHDFPEMFKEGGEGLEYKDLGAGNPMIDTKGKPKAYFGQFPCLFREEKDDPKVGSKSQYVLSMYGDDWTRVQDASGNLNEKGKDKTIDYVYNWGVIYGIKNQGTPKAYRIKWEVKVVGTPIKEVSDLSAAKRFCENSNTTMYEGKTAQQYDHLYCYLVISRYPATAADDLSPDEKGSCEWVAKDKEWWSNPAEVMYLPIGGVAGQFRSGRLYNIGTEVRYGLVDESKKTYTDKGTSYEGAYKRCVWLKIAGSSTASLGLFLEDSYTSDLISIRPVRD